MKEGYYEMKFFRIIISKVCEDHDVDTKDWDDEKWDVIFKECGDLSDTWLLDVNDVDGWMDMSSWEIAEYNALDGLRFVGILEPTGEESWYGTYTREDNPNFQRYGAYAKSSKSKCGKCLVDGTCDNPICESYTGNK